MSCPPRFATRRRPQRETFGHELAAVAEKLGQPFMPWQRFVADVGCEIDPLTGLPAYREVRVTIPRQSGKTTLFLSWQINRCVSRRWSHPQRSAFTAQTGKDARDKWIDELFPLIRNSALKSLVASSGSRLVINEGMGNESIRFKTGSIIRLLSTSASSGHSKTLHQAVMDEVWHDSDDRREQGLRPAMITIRDAQLLVCSTAGTAASIVLNRKVETGREAALADTGFGVAYFEWSALPGWDPDDWDSYFTFSPALCPDPPCRCAPPGEGWRHTITLEALRAERDAMELPEFMRAYGNVPTGVTGPKWQVVSQQVWQDACDPQSRPRDRIAIGVDVLQDRSVAAIGAAGHRDDRLSHVELTGSDVEGTDYRQGAGWVLPRLIQIDEHEPCVMVINDKLLADQAEAAGLVVYRPQARDVAAWCGGFFDAVAGLHVASRHLRHRGQAELDDAVEMAAKRMIGTSGWAWAQNPVLTAVSLAHGALHTPKIHRVERRPQSAFVAQGVPGRQRPREYDEQGNRVIRMGGGEQ